MKKLLLLISILLIAQPALAQSETDFEKHVFRAEVVQVLSSGEQAITGTALTEDFQKLQVRIIDGERMNEVHEVDNRSGIELAPDDIFYLHNIQSEDGTDVWSVGEPDRRWVLIGLTLLFIVSTVLLAGKPGARALVALAGSFLIIIFALVPALSAGAPPVLTCTALAVAILAFSMFVTHGWNNRTFIALGGSVLALTFAAAIAQAAVVLAQMSGFVSDETVSLNFMTQGTLNLPGLLLGGILIGVVGVLNDISVSQVHTVGEIHTANPDLDWTHVLQTSMRVGREHLGAVVNTLPLAYAGAALPLLLIFGASDAPILFTLNREIFAAEIIRTLAGGMGLMLSGAIATVLAAYVLVKLNLDDKRPHDTIHHKH
ncbi:YibE/F family protein [Patescibacteria group bacterium]|nr:YibE/F family protein [Patescibacteria group bacterium]MBU1755185.1 YibE/F family protein [Patescibacteria group bacterium]